jgi:glycosyltransferase involved in cell wall biosynthesis
MIWHLITPEYPPQPGGVSDYTRLIADGLSDAGDEVHIWCPTEEPRSEARGPTEKSESEGGDQRPDRTLIVHRELGRFTRSDLRRAGRMLDQFKAPRRLLIQWVPHGYRYSAMNLHFCLWLLLRARRGDNVEIMVHEPFLSFGEGSWKQKGVAVVQRLMTVVLLRAASRVWMTIPSWEKHLSPYTLGRTLSFGWLPVANNIPVVNDPDDVQAIRARYTKGGGTLVGHFGAYDRHTSKLLLKTVPVLTKNGNPQAMLLVGRGSELMREQLIRQHPETANRMYATGELNARDLSLHLSACDLMLQPYVDGVSSRRTSTMVALAHGVPVVTTSGELTEPLWAESQAVVLAAVENISVLPELIPRLLANSEERRAISGRARDLYQKRFDIRHTIRALKGGQK